MGVKVGAGEGLGVLVGWGVPVSSGGGVVGSGQPRI